MVGSRLALVAASLTMAVPALAGEMTPEHARRFVVGKVFAYTCFEGTTGAGRILSDGSVAGTLQMQGKGPVRRPALPAGKKMLSPDELGRVFRAQMAGPVAEAGAAPATRAAVELLHRFGVRRRRWHYCRPWAQGLLQRRDRRAAGLGYVAALTDSGCLAGWGQGDGTGR